MRPGDLVKWSDPGKDETGIVIETPCSQRVWDRDDRMKVLWCSVKGPKMSCPRIFQVELVEPRKINEGR
jgi:hypothetical protein